MSKNLSKLLGKSEDEITQFVSTVEAMCGFPSEDVRLVSDTKATAAHLISSINLDPRDTTGRELSAALKLKFHDDSSLFAKALGLGGLKSTDSRNTAIANLAASLSGTTWAIKKHVAKDIIESTPPKKVMKALGYRSAPSMLKREDINVIYAAVSVLESVRFQQTFWRKHCSLRPSDFEVRPVEFRTMASEQWKFVSSRAGIVTCILPLGAAVVWPGKAISGAALSVLLFEAAEHLKHYSCALKLEEMNSLFGHKVLELMSPDLSSPATLANSKISWHVLHRHYGRHDPEKLPLLFDPHLRTEDLHATTVSESMAKIHPGFSWWAKSQTVGHLSESLCVSMNLSDIVASSLGLGDKSYSLGKSLWSELLSRYMSHEGFEKHILSQLDNVSQEKETVSISFSKTRKSPQAMIQAEFA